MPSVSSAHVAFNPHRFGTPDGEKPRLFNVGNVSNSDAPAPRVMGGVQLSRAAGANFSQLFGQRCVQARFAGDRSEELGRRLETIAPRLTAMQRDLIASSQMILLHQQDGVNKSAFVGKLDAWVGSIEKVLGNGTPDSATCYTGGSGSRDVVKMEESLNKAVSKYFDAHEDDLHDFIGRELLHPELKRMSAAKGLSSDAPVEDVLRNASVQLWRTQLTSLRSGGHITSYLAHVLRLPELDQRPAGPEAGNPPPPATSHDGPNGVPMGGPLAGPGQAIAGPSPSINISFGDVGSGNSSKATVDERQHHETSAETTKAIIEALKGAHTRIDNARLDHISDLRNFLRNVGNKSNGLIGQNTGGVPRGGGGGDPVLGGGSGGGFDVSSTLPGSNIGPRVTSETFANTNRQTGPGAGGVQYEQRERRASSEIVDRQSSGHVSRLINFFESKAKEQSRLTQHHSVQVQSTDREISWAHQKSLSDGSLRAPQKTGQVYLTNGLTPPLGRGVGRNGFQVNAQGISYQSPFPRETTPGLNMRAKPSAGSNPITRAVEATFASNASAPLKERAVKLLSDLAPERWMLNDQNEFEGMCMALANQTDILLKERILGEGISSGPVLRDIPARDSFTRIREVTKMLRLEERLPKLKDEDVSMLTRSLQNVVRERVTGTRAPDAQRMEPEVRRNNNDHAGESHGRAALRSQGASEGRGEEGGQGNNLTPPPFRPESAVFRGPVTPSPIKAPNDNHAALLEEIQRGVELRHVHLTEQVSKPLDPQDAVINELKRGNTILKPVNKTTLPPPLKSSAPWDQLMAEIREKKGLPSRDIEAGQSIKTVSGTGAGETAEASKDGIHTWPTYAKYKDLSPDLASHLGKVLANPEAVGPTRDLLMHIGNLDTAFDAVNALAFTRLRRDLTSKISEMIKEIGEDAVAVDTKLLQAQGIAAIRLHDLMDTGLPALAMVVAGKAPEVRQPIYRKLEEIIASFNSRTP